MQQTPVTIDNVSNKQVAYYDLWDGEVFVTVSQHIGVHGFFSASMCVERCDSPMECYMYDGYTPALRSVKAGGQGTAVAHVTMKQWVASKLNTLATGTGLAVGTYSAVEEVESRDVSEDEYAALLALLVET